MRGFRGAEAFPVACGCSSSLEGVPDALRAFQKGRRAVPEGAEGGRRKEGKRRGRRGRLPDAGEAALKEAAEVILPVGPSMAASGFVIEVLNMIQFEPLAVVLELLIEEIIRSDSNPIHGRHLS